MAEGAETHSSRLTAQTRTAIRIQYDQFKNTQHHNLKTFLRQPLQEISGSFGDLGTLLPILIAYTDEDPAGIDLGSTLVFTGLSNIFTGLIFGIPLPVQPMKAIAAVALSRHFNKAEVASAGLFVAAVIGLLSITGLLSWFSRRVPTPVIKGIQVGVGLSLFSYAGTVLSKSEKYSWEFSDIHYQLVLLAFLSLLASFTFRKAPIALILLFAGIVVALPKLIRDPSGLGIWQPHAFIPPFRSFWNEGITAGLGQIPLTTLNSIIAVSALSADLLPDVPAPTPTAMGFSVAVMNLIGCWFGSMPVCHGSGGLAAQYRFGARSGASIIFLGLIKLVLGLFAGPFAKQAFRDFPNAILGIMVFAAALEIANVGETLNTTGARDLMEGKDGIATALLRPGQPAVPGEELTREMRTRRWTIMFITAGAILTFKNDAIGFIAGMLCHCSYQLHDRYIARRSQREGTIRLGNEGGQSFQANAR
ncbi:MAG: hypothetical protein LQ349_008765 [Xanthoria aureola]|nr:MAG: hypothetical protein LQ349_008765 [Xanthoria aureola]